MNQGFGGLRLRLSRPTKTHLRSRTPLGSPSPCPQTHTLRSSPRRSPGALPPVMPAQAGIQRHELRRRHSDTQATSAPARQRHWVPACAGTTRVAKCSRSRIPLGSTRACPQTLALCGSPVSCCDFSAHQIYQTGKFSGISSLAFFICHARCVALRASAGYKPPRCVLLWT